MVAPLILLPECPSCLPSHAGSRASKIKLPEIDLFGPEVARNASGLWNFSSALLTHGELKTANYGQLRGRAKDERDREAAGQRGFLSSPSFPIPFDRPTLPVALHLLYQIAQVLPASSHAAELEVRVQQSHTREIVLPYGPFPPPHAGGLPTPGSRHHNAPSVTTCPHHTDRKRLGQMERSLERGVGNWLGCYLPTQDDRSNRQVKVWIHANVCFLKAAPVKGWRRHGRTWRNGGQWRLSVGVAGPCLLPHSWQIWCQSEKRPPTQVRLLISPLSTRPS